MMDYKFNTRITTIWPKEPKNKSWAEWKFMMIKFAMMTLMIATMTQTLISWGESHSIQGLDSLGLQISKAKMHQLDCTHQWDPMTKWEMGTGTQRSYISSKFKWINLCSKTQIKSTIIPTPEATCQKLLKNFDPISTKQGDRISLIDKLSNKELRRDWLAII